MSQRSEHTKEPWTQDRWGHVLGGDNDPLLVNGISFPTGNHPAAQEATANTRRIVACVNFCQDIETARLEELVANGIKANDLRNNR